MNNRLTELFLKKNKRVLNVYCTAGYPEIDSMPKVLAALQDNGADIIEIGIPYSDPVADGPVIQQSNMAALENGMTLHLLFEQLQQIKNDIHLPVILMGYFNPVMQYGVEHFCADAAAAGVAGIILPDLPMQEYEKSYQKIFEQHGLSFIFLITPQTSDKRIKKADALSTGFLYAVSSSSVTGSAVNTGEQKSYFERISGLKLKNPLLIGFGIGDRKSFDFACEYAAGAVTGSAYIKALGKNKAGIAQATHGFIASLTNGHI
jgi:tryptophan synthase alpha chain